MPRLIHRRSRATTLVDDSSATATAAHAAQVEMADIQPDSSIPQPVDDMKVSGGNTKSYFSRNRPMQRSTSTRTEIDWQRSGSASSKSAPSVRKNNRTQRVQSFKSTRSPRLEKETSDDSASSDSDGSSVVEDEENDAVNSSDSILTSSDDSGNENASENEHDSSDPEKDDQSTSEVEEDRDASEAEDFHVNKKSSYARFAPVRSSAGSGDRQSKVNRLDDRRPAATAKSQRAVGGEVIYIRVPHATSSDVQRKLLRRLRNEYPGTLIVLDDSPTKTPFAERTSFSLLWRRIQDGRVDCIWIPRMSHISKSKEAFQLFEWMCDEHRVPILLQPALEVAVKTARTNK
jgi:hypothetical protein